MSSGRQDFLGDYKAISTKLKKRFLRKPNVSEASSKFGELAKQLELEECPHYSAFCCLAVARCENTLGNAVEESQALVKAARLFFEAEELNYELLCPGFSENLNGALSCYNHALKVYLEQNQVALAAALCLEVGKALQHVERISQAIPYYQKAASLQNQCTVDYINTLQLIADCKIETGDLDGALNVLTEICDILEEKKSANEGEISGVFSSLLADSEITKVLLLLFIQPTQQRLTPSNVKTLERYSCEETLDKENAPTYINEELFILMQSLVLACQSNDTEAIEALQKDLWSHLSPKQMDLLHKVTEKICR